MARTTAQTPTDKLVSFPKERKAAPRPGPRAKIIANLEAERNTLGSLMILCAGDEPDDRALQVLGMLEPADFYESKHQLIFTAMQALHAAGKPFGNVVLITDYLRDNGQLSDAGGQAYVSGRANETAIADSVQHYARTVFDVSIERQTQNIATEGSQLKIAPDVLADRLRALVERRQLVEHHGAALPGVMLSDVQKEAIHWAWTGRAAYGKATMLDGDGGEGKGLITTDLTARATTGRPMPGETEAAPPMNVILIAPEDSAADTIRPRLEAAGGDPSRVRLMAEIQEGSTVRGFSIPRDVPLLEEVIQRDNAKLVIIDPIMACLDAGVKTHVDSEVRAALMPLKQVIERTGAVLIMVRHFTKASDSRAAYRGGGSVAFTNLARFGLIVGKHPDNPDVRVLALAKSNYRKVGSLAYRIADLGGDLARIQWDQRARQVDADTLLAAHNTTEMRDTLAALEDVGKPATVKDMLTHWPDGAEKPTLDTLRRRMSRYADSGLVVKHGEGIYALPTSTPDPSEGMSNMSYLSGVSDMSDMSDKHRTPSDSRTCRTGGIGSDMLADPATCGHEETAVGSDGTLSCATCSAILWRA